MCCLVGRPMQFILLSSSGPAQLVKLGLLDMDSAFSCVTKHLSNRGPLTQSVVEW